MTLTSADIGRLIRTRIRKCTSGLGRGRWGKGHVTSYALQYFSVAFFVGLSCLLALFPSLPFSVVTVPKRRAGREGREKEEKRRVLMLMLSERSRTYYALRPHRFMCAVCAALCGAVRMQELALPLSNRRRG